MRINFSPLKIVFILLSLYWLSTGLTIQAQCPVTAFVTNATINCGDTVELGALADGCKPLNNNFNGGTIGPDWSASPGGVVTDGTGGYSCAGPPPEGDNYLWMGATVGAPRGVTTNIYDLTQCDATSGSICFELKFATQGGPDPCEGIDIAGEGIFVQYSIDGGGTWITIQFYDPNGGYDPTLTSWNRYCLNIPPAAMITTTMFRWYQGESSGAGYDTWGLDNMVITLNAPAYTYDWAHDTQGPDASPVTPAVGPTSTTTYTVTYTNGVETCSSPVTVAVKLPTVAAALDLANICAGASAQLAANSSLQASPPTACAGVPVECNPNNTIAIEEQVGFGNMLSQTGNPGIGYLGASNFDGAVRSQFLLRAEDLISAGLTAGKFTTMQFDIANNDEGTKTFNDFEITFMCTNKTQMSNDYDPMSNGVIIYDAKPTSISSGWHTIFFDQGYDWDGTTNIMINMCWRSAQGATIQTRHYSTPYAGTKTDGTNTASNGGVWRYCADDSDPFTDNYNSLPNFKFGMCVPRPGDLIYTWSPTEGLDNPNIHNPVATPDNTTTYTVTVQESGTPAACVATDNVTVTVVKPEVTISSACSGDEIIFTANGTTTGSVGSGPITNNNTASEPEYNVDTYIEKCIDVSNINPNTYPAGLVNVFVDMTHCDPKEIDIQIKGPGGAWTTLAGLTNGGKNWVSLPAGAATSLNGQWCIQYKDNCVGCGLVAGIDDCGGAFFNSWNITIDNEAGSNQIVEYTWSPPTSLNTSTGPVVQSSSESPITYTVTVKDAVGCIAQESITVSLPTVSAGIDQAVCSGGSVTLSGSGATNYVWDNGVIDGVAFTPTVTTTYVVTSADGSDCESSDTVIITVNNCSQPTASYAPSSTSVCVGSDIVFTDNSTGANVNSWTWNFAGGIAGSASGQGPHTIRFDTVGTYDVLLQITDDNGPDDTTMTITVNPLPTVDAGIDQAVCSGSAVILSGDGATNYVWDNGVNDGVAFTPTVTNTYTVIGTDGSGCENTDEVIVTVDQCLPSTASYIPSSTSICVGSDILFLDNSRGTNISSWTWTFPGSVAGSANVQGPHNIRFDTAGVYQVTLQITDGNLTDDTTMLIAVNPLPTVDAGIDQAVCSGESVTLSGSGATNYVWNNGVVDGVPFNPTITNTYTVTGTDGNGCENTDEVMVTVNGCIAPLEASYIPSSTSVCVGSDIVFTDNSSGANIISWTWTFAGGVAGSANVKGPHTIRFDTAGVYSVILQIADDNGTDDTTMTITVHPNPTVDAGTDQTICSGGTVTLSGSGATNYVWDNGVVDGESFSPGTTNSYVVTVTDVNGCENTDEVIVTVNNCAQPTASYIPSSTSVCIGSDIVFTDNSTGTNVNSWTWSFAGGLVGNANGQGPHTIRFNTVGTYDIILQIMDDNGADDTTMTITINPLPTVDAGTDQAACTGTAVTLSGSGAISYVWNNGVSDGVAFTPTTTTTYTVTGTDGNGCSNTGQVVVTVNPLPPVDAGTDQAACTGTAVTLTGSGATTYVWDYGVSDGVAFTPTATNTYTVTGTDGNGCENTDEVIVTVNNCTSELTASYAPSATVICLGDSITFTDNSTGMNISSWNWIFNGGTPNNMNTQGPHTVQYNTPGTYNVILQITDDNGFDDTTMTITVQALPTVVAGLDQAVCSGDTVTLNGSGATSYVWDNGVGNGVAFTPTVTNTCTVTGTDGNGCRDTDQVVVNVLVPPTPQFTVDTLILCLKPQQSFTFYNQTETSGGAIGSSFWNFGDNTGYTGDTVSHSYTTAGSYSISLTTSSLIDNSCSATLTKQNYVNVYNNPIADFTTTPEIITMLNPTVNFMDASSLNIIMWSWDINGMDTFNTQNSSYTFPEDTGTYYVNLSVTDNNGCKSSKETNIVIAGDYSIYVPTAFTPDGDSFNEGFAPKGFGVSKDNYSFLIFNRWGELLFETHTKFEPWDAYYKGSLMHAGNYVWKLNFEDLNNVSYQQIGTVTIIK
jgi:gliding motility-associated-like protein